MKQANAAVGRHQDRMDIHGTNEALEANEPFCLR